jgi:hypothetical protein
VAASPDELGGEQEGDREDDLSQTVLTLRAVLRRGTPKSTATSGCVLNRPHTVPSPVDGAHSKEETPACRVSPLPHRVSNLGSRRTESCRAARSMHKPIGDAYSAGEHGR